jgi:hypothetical protein
MRVRPGRDRASRARHRARRSMMASFSRGASFSMALVSPAGPLLRIHGVEACEMRSFHRGTTSRNNTAARIRGGRIRLRDCPGVDS